MDIGRRIGHQLDEQTHHGAELGVLRDRYRHDQGTATRSADHG